MRRALIATAATVVGLVALLDYRSSGAIRRSHTAVGSGSPVSTATVPPATTGSGATPTTGAPAGGGSTAAPGAAAGPKEYTGADVPYNYGDIQLRITVAATRITAISVVQESATDPRSQFINSQAVPILTQEALAAQGLHFDVVSGATFTSNAFAQALQSALSKEV